MLYALRRTALSTASGTDQHLTVSDQHGDVIAAMPTTDQMVADSTSYDPWGTVTAGTKRPIGYQGDYTDPDTDQVNMTTRWYNPGNRWLHQPRRHRAANRPIIGSGLCPLPPEVRVLTGGCGQLGRGKAGEEQLPLTPLYARQQNREAARNNPMPIPNAMLNPLYGSSVSPPVSSAPDVPSRSADDYRDPVDDTNDTYQNLLDSLTTDNGTLLGSVPDTTAAPAEMQPINYPTDPGDINDLIEDSYKNAGKCQPFEGTQLGEHCKGIATSPNFENQMGAEMGLLELDVIAPVGKALSPLLGLFDPTADARDCLNGGQGACWWAAMGVFPFGRFGRALRNIDDLGRGGGSALRYIQPPKRVR